VVDDEPAPVAEWLPELAQTLGSAGQAASWPLCGRSGQRAARHHCAGRRAAVWPEPL